MVHFSSKLGIERPPDTSVRLELESLSRQVVGLESVAEHARDPSVHAILRFRSFAGSIPMQSEAIGSQKAGHRVFPAVSERSVSTGMES